MTTSFKSTISNRNQYFSQFIEAKDYSDIEEITKAFPHLVSLKHNNFKITQPCHSLVIRSGNDDNIHKAIKYGVWTTTFRNKNKLQEYWKDHQQKGTETYLFFSAVKSGHFEGVAKLSSGYHQETFPFWWQNQHGKFKGHFDIEWLYVKDITYRHFEGLNNLQGQDVTKSKDCDQLSFQTTKQMFKIYQNYKKDKSIFSTFKFFDERQQSELRSDFTLQQQQMMLLQYQYQYQQQMMYATMPVQSVTHQPIPQNQGATKKGFITNNPGFQMNPVSKNKKNAGKQGKS